jgi:hypothetical protein
LASMVDPRKYIEFFSSHAILYILGLVFVFSLIIVEEVFGFMTYSGKAIAMLF